MAGRAFWDGWYSVAVPCCRLCGWRLHAWRLGRTVAFISILVGGLLFYFALKRITAEWLAAVTAIITGLALLIGKTIWEQRFPPPFDFEPAGDKVSFDFRDLSLGYEFRAINAPADEAGRLTSA